MEATVESITEMKSERVEQDTDKEIETGEQSQDYVKETEIKNPEEAVEEEAPIREHKYSPCSMVVKEDASLASSRVAHTFENETSNDDTQTNDDEKTHTHKNPQLERSPHLISSPSVALAPEEELIKPTVEDSVEHNVGSNEVSLDILKSDGGSVMVDKDTAVEITTIPETELSEEKISQHHHASPVNVMEQDKAAEYHDIISSGNHNEHLVNPDTKLSDASQEKGSPHHLDNTVMEQDNAVEEHDMISSGDNNNFSLNPDTKLSTEKGSPHHHANTVMEQEKAAEDHSIISSGDHNEYLVNPDTKRSEESEDKGSPHHLDSTVNKRENDAEEHDMISSGDHNKLLVNPDTKLSDELEDKSSPHHLDNAVMEWENDGEEHDMISSGDHNELLVNLDTKLSDESEEKGSLHLLDNTVMEQENDAEEHDMISPGDHNKFPVNPDIKLSEDKGSLHYANTEMEQEKSAEEHEIVSSGEHNEFPANPDTKIVEATNMNLADHGNGPVDHDQRTTMELDKDPEVPGSETVSNLENKPSERFIETSMNAEKAPGMSATENLTENDQNTDVLAPGVSVDSDKGLSLLPAAQTSSDHNNGMATLEGEPTEEMEVDVPDSKFVTNANVDSTNNKDVNAEAPTNAEKKDNSIAPETNDADNEIVSLRTESVPPCVASSDIKSETGVNAHLNNGAHENNLAPPAFDEGMNSTRSFLLDDMSEGNESGTEEDQSDFMKELDHFFRERNMEFKPPKFYGEGLNCLKLWRAVIRLGGYEKVTGSKLWRSVGEPFRPPKTCTTVSWTFRGFYEKALLEYERHKVSTGELHIPLASEPEPMNVDNHASGSGRARRDSATRAMQGWHSQRNGDASDPAVKDKNLVLHQKREKHIGTIPGSHKRKRPYSAEHSAKHAMIVSKPMLDVTVVDVGPPADWVKINVQKTQDCFEVYALVPGLVREEVRVQSDPAGRLVISGEPENPTNPWGATPFKKVVSLPTRIDPHHTSAVVTLNGQLFVRVPLEQSG